MSFPAAYPFPHMESSPQPPNPPNPPDHELKSSNTQESKFREYAARHRRWLLPIFFICLAGIIVGIVFAAHYHYHRFGGQGWLRTRSQGSREEIPKLFLPLRKLETQLEIEERSSWFGWWKRTPRSVPFYICGDQQKSCEAHNQPNVCCPINMFCYPTTVTPSNIFCCNATEESGCEASLTNPPQCLPNTEQCPENVGGGCCRQETICTPNGCLEDANIQSSSPGTDASDAVTLSTYSSISKTTTESSNDNNPGSPPATEATVTPVITKTITVVESAIVTSPKDGEVAQKGEAANRSLIMALCAPYGPALALLMIAAMMGLL